VRTSVPLGDDRHDMRVIHQLERPPRRASPLGVVARSSRSDEDLLELVAKRRDEAAFDELYRRYAKAVYGVVRRLIGDHEDVVQEAFTNAWRAAAGYRRELGPATGWLFAIARNAAVDALRSRAAESHSELPDLPDDGPGPDERASAAEEAFRVHAAVDGLPDQEREVIELAYFDGLSQSEVAARLGMPLGTVKTRTRRALAHLADRLAEERVMRRATSTSSGSRVCDLSG
jgi:RNA polymerase sigma-70 factor (ECF subfamily)